MSIRLSLVVLACLSSTAAFSQDITRDGERAGARIGAGVGEIVGGAVEGAGRIVDSLTAPRPRETVIIERPAPEVYGPSLPCVRTADGRRVCEGD